MNKVRGRLGAPFKLDYSAEQFFKLCHRRKNNIRKAARATGWQLVENQQLCTVDVVPLQDADAVPKNDSATCNDVVVIKNVQQINIIDDQSDEAPGSSASAMETNQK